MSCGGCRRAVDAARHGWPYRWRDADVVVLACEPHFYQMRAALDAAQHHLAQDHA